MENASYGENLFAEELEEKYAHLQKRYFRKKDLEQFVRWAAKTAHASGISFARMKELVVAAFKSTHTQVLKGPVVWVGAEPACIEFSASMTMQVGTREIEISIPV